MSREIEDAHKRLADKDREVERLLRSPHSSTSRDDRPSRSATLTKSRSLDADEQVGYNAQKYAGKTIATYNCGKRSRKPHNYRDI